MAVGAHVQVRLPAATNLPEDDVINTFNILGDPNGFETPGSLSGLFGNFYNQGHPNDGFSNIADFISGAITRNRPVVVTAYSLADPMPRQPINEETFTLGQAAAADSLPLEVAACLSYHALPVSGSAMRRRRGRVYIGPLTTLAVTEVGQVPMVSLDLQNTLAEAAKFLQSVTSNAWAVWSRADDVLRPVVGGWVDNEFDTQRRRGRRATGRVTFSA